MTRLAFTADLHCDDFGSTIDPATGLNARWIDTVEMVRWIARDAAARGCEALIVGGDFTEQRHPAPWRVAQIREALDEYLGERDGGLIFLLRGNHDGIRAGRSIVDLLSPETDPSWAGASEPWVGQVGDTAVALLPYLDRHNIRAIEGFEQLPEGDVAAALGEAYLTIARGLYVQSLEQPGLAGHTTSRILVVHQALAGGLMSDSQAAFLGDQGLIVDTRALAAIGFDAILAGHFHKHQVLSTAPLVAYAGSPYRTDFGEEHQAKGYLVIDVEPGKTTMEFVETPARRFVTVDAEHWPQAPGDIGGPASDFLEGAIVRVLNVPPEDNVADVRRTLEDLGAFEVQEIRVKPTSRPEPAGPFSESLSSEQALAAYFAEDTDREALVGLGREILEAVRA